MTYYNDGKWHRFSGNSCPVHPKSKVITSHLARGIPATNEVPYAAGNQAWLNVTAFRVVSPYAEPQEYSGECYAYHFTELAPSLVSAPLSDTVLGKWTATHVNGKLSRITWDASE